MMKMAVPIVLRPNEQLPQPFADMIQQSEWAGLERWSSQAVLQMSDTH